MYRIQAFNLWTKKHEVIYVPNMDERNKTIKALQANPDYGLVTFEHLPRGFACY